MYCGLDEQNSGRCEGRNLERSITTDTFCKAFIIKTLRKTIKSLNFFFFFLQNMTENVCRGINQQGLMGKERRKKNTFLLSRKQLGLNQNTNGQLKRFAGNKLERKEDKMLLASKKNKKKKNSR